MIKAELLTRTLEDLGKCYLLGLYEFLFKHRSDLHQQRLDLEDRIDVAFLADSVGIEEFKAILRDYWKLHMKVIREFKQAGKLNLNLVAKARQEMTEARIRA